MSEASGPAAGGRVLVVRPTDAGKRVEAFLARRLPEASWSHVNRLLRQRRVEVDGVVARRGDELRGGERVVVLPAAAASEAGPRPPAPNRRLRVTVLHEDADLVVVLKAAGLPVQPGPGHGTDTLLNVVAARWADALELGPDRGWGLVHRLDLETSGPLVLARTPAAYDGLVAAFAGRQVEKEYLALVRGAAPARGEVATPVAGKDALTRFERREQGRGASLVAAWPVTGRTHQVRVHLASIGHPLLGDARHGDPAKDPVRAPRVALHCRRLAFTHPVTGAPMVFELDLPRDLKRTWRQLAPRRVADDEVE